ncbi:ubiquitin-ribosomal protein eL40 fusion protein-like [Argopecten irradians]|uniref:ubiquitin-ribosomal protein eL40 fusion protein-like n=1 Tax=Argopecten irradians TaxID=31199 RepID=UPI003715232D
MADMIQLFVRSGTNRNTIIEVHKDASVEDLMRKIYNWNKIDMESQRVIFEAKELQMTKDGRKMYLSDYNLRDRLQLNVVFHPPRSQTVEDPRLEILKSAPRKTIAGLYACPSIRACPKCGSLIKHTSGGKHMVCVCGQKFCFICLIKPGTDGKYRCGAYNSHCTIAPIQINIGNMDEDNGEDEQGGGWRCTLM